MTTLLSLPKSCLNWINTRKLSQLNICNQNVILTNWQHEVYNCTWNTHTLSHLTALCPGLPGWAGARKVKPIWILLKQQTVSGSGISCTICKSAPRSRQIALPAPHHSVFYRPDALPVAQPTAPKHWRQIIVHENAYIYLQASTNASI